MDLVLYLKFSLTLYLSKNFYVESKYIIQLENGGIGRKFDGIGAISGGGATSKLLVNYPIKERSEIFDFLFKPNFGASLNILKVEIGGDAQSTEGTEASHMRHSWDLNFNRGYEWWIMKEAKLRNPDIKLYGLAWGFPGWINPFGWWPYKYPDKTVHYIVSWILGAKKHHNLTIDYIGLWNEKPYDKEYVKLLRKSLDSAHLSEVKIVGADMNGPTSWVIANDMITDPLLNQSISVIGGHYSGAHSTKAAQSLNKPLWSTEDYAWDNGELGGGCLGRKLNQNYIYGKMTATIAWNLVASFYNKLPDPLSGLMTANNPWSGHYSVETPIWSAAHTSQFVKPGWNYLEEKHGSGELLHGGTYVSFVNPSKSHLTIVVETFNTMDANFCVRLPQVRTPTYDQNATFVIEGQLKNILYLQLWQSNFGLGSVPSIIFAKSHLIKVKNGSFTIFLEKNSLYTITSNLTAGHKGYYPSVPKSSHFPCPYKDNFDSYDLYQEAANFAQQVGAFEVIDSGNLTHKKVLQQSVLDAPIYWCPDLQTQPINLIGNYNWSNSVVSVDVLFNSTNTTRGVFIGARVDHGGCTTFTTSGIFLFLLYEEQKYQLSLDLARTKTIDKGKIDIKLDTWYHLTLHVNGNSVIGKVNSKEITNFEVNKECSKGFLAIGTDDFGLASFDNFIISSCSFTCD